MNKLRNTKTDNINICYLLYEEKILTNQLLVTDISNETKHQFERKSRQLLTSYSNRVEQEEPAKNTLIKESRATPVGCETERTLICIYCLHSMIWITIFPLGLLFHYLLLTETSWRHVCYGKTANGKSSLLFASLLLLAESMIYFLAVSVFIYLTPTWSLSKTFVLPERRKGQL